MPNEVIVLGFQPLSLVNKVGQPIRTMYRNGLVHAGSQLIEITQKNILDYSLHVSIHIFPYNIVQEAKIIP